MSDESAMDPQLLEQARAVVAAIRGQGREADGTAGA